MKAIGKNSIASILAVGLNVVRAVLWVGLAGLTVAVVIAPFVTVLGGVLMDAAGPWGVDVDVDVTVDDGRDRVADFVGLLSVWFTFAIMLYVVERLLELLKTLRFGSPFVAENAVRFRNIGWALLLGEGLKIAFGVLGAALDAEAGGGFDLVTFVAIAAVFVLSEVFREGARMKDEQDLTV